MIDFRNIKKYDESDPEFVSVIDELPFWSAPFGMKMLGQLKIRKNITGLDIGSGLGFPLLEVAMRLGITCRLFGVDIWKEGIDRIRKKIKIYKLGNVWIFNAQAENLPFENDYFDLVFSNNGINNVQNLEKTLTEIKRVTKKGAQFLMTMNLDKTMIEFYDIFEEVLNNNGMFEEIKNMKRHIYEKRRPVSEIVDLLKSNLFNDIKIYEDSFDYKFADAEAVFNYLLIKAYFLESWLNLLPFNETDRIFNEVYKKMDKFAELNGNFKLTIPYVLIDCVKN
ncbi:MAG: class I SAM-dependent methyltransferase [Ignavibacteria bacterium]|nr:class I SAM-dependent methyltransferase [Ignavibacteria bacterium]